MQPEAVLSRVILVNRDPFGLFSLGEIGGERSSHNNMTIEDDAPAAVPEWILTYGDMMSLLLTFFIMLVSMSEMKSPEQFHAIADSMRQQFGLDVASTHFVPGWAKPRDSRLVKTVAAGRSLKQTSEESSSPVESQYHHRSNHQTVLPGGAPAVAATVYFAESSVELSAQNKQDLQVFALGLIGKSFKIEIRGHSSPPATNDSDAYNDCWDLAYLRGQNIMRYLVEGQKIDPRRVRISTVGPNEPAQIGTDPLKLRRNDRAEIHFLEEIVIDNS